jgi:hypothetical protein
LASGPVSVAEWLRSFVTFSNSVGSQGELSSLAGLYYEWAPPAVRLLFTACTLAAAAVITWLAWRRLRPELPVPLASTGWLWGIWFLATPYAHFNDEIVLIIPVLALLGRDGASLLRPASILTLYLLLFSVIPYDLAPPHVQVVCIPLIAVTVCLLWGARKSTHTDGAAKLPTGRIDRLVAVSAGPPPATLQ